MTMNGPLQSGAVEIVNPSTREVIGYAYTVETGRGQLQRWLLFLNPHGALEVRPPPEHMAGWSLSDWQAHVPSLWKPGSFYVWAQADVYRHGDTYDGVTWSQIPPVSQLPEPSYYPSPPDGHFQLDTRLVKFLLDSQVGYVFTMCSLLDSASQEYWSMPAGAQAAGGACTLAVAPAADDVGSLGAFIDMANQSFGPGSSFAITGCVNYHGDAPPPQA